MFNYIKHVETKNNDKSNNPQPKLIIKLISVAKMIYHIMWYTYTLLENNNTNRH